MTWMQFLSSIFASLAWPFAVLIAAKMFKGELKALLHRLRSGKVLGTEWNFGDGIQKLEEGRAKVEDRAKSAERSPQPFHKTQPVYADDRMLRLAQEANDNPSYAILTAWEVVRGAARDLLGTIQSYPAKGGPVAARTDESRLLRGAEKQHVIASGLSEMYEELRNLRNRVAHGAANPTTGEAVAYVESADVLVDLLIEEVNNVIARTP